MRLRKPVLAGITTALLLSLLLILVLGSDRFSSPSDASVRSSESSSVDQIAASETTAHPNRERRQSLSTAKAGAETARRYLIRSATTGQALAAARVTVRVPAGSARHFDCDPKGAVLVRVPANGSDDRSSCVLSVSCPGFVRLQTNTTLPPEGATLLLDPAGALTVTVLDARGKPQVGKTVRLLPPVDSGEPWSESHGADFPTPLVAKEADRPHPQPLRQTPAGWVAAAKPMSLGSRLVAPEFLAFPDSAWTGTTNRAGAVTFDQLPAAPGYRIAAPSGLHSEMTPAHENAKFRGASDHVQISTPAVPGLSGEIEVLAAEGPATAGIRLLGAGTLTGRIDSGPTTISPQVKLYRVNRVRSQDGKLLVAMDMEAFVPADTEGKFRFENVVPGEFLIRAWWQSGESDLFFAARGAIVKDQAVEDLGTLTAQRGATVSTKISLTDLHGARLNPEAVVGPKKAFSFLTIESIPDSRDAADSIYEAVMVSFDKRYTIHGLAAGRLMFRTNAQHWPQTPENGGDTTAGSKPTLLVPFQKEYRARVAETSHVDLQLRVEIRRSRQLVLRFPAGEDAPSNVELWARHVKSGAAHQVPLRPQSAPDGSRAFEVSLPTGAHQLLCRTHGAGSQPGHWALATVDGTDSAPILLSLKPGAAVQGTLVDRQGAPQPNTHLRWSTPGWTHKGEPAWIFLSRTDAKGAFRLAGLPPGLKLIPTSAPRSLPALGAAGVHSVTLRED